MSDWESFDHLAANALPDPAAVLARLQDACPVGHSGRYGGFSVLTRAADVREAARRTDLFTSVPNPGPGAGFPFSSGDRVVTPMIGNDPPLHRDYRGPLQKYFSPPRTEGLAPRIREIVTTLIDDFIAAGRADLAVQLAIPLPTIVTAELLALPPDSRADFQRWATELIAEGPACDGYRHLTAYIEEQYEARIRSRGSDLPSELLDLTIGGEPISRAQWVGLILLLILAGLDTTTNGAALMLHFLGTHPEVRAQIAANPGGLPSAIEELLRWTSPVPQHSRGVVRDCSIGDHEFHGGEVVLLHWLAANRDPDEFPEPNRFIADRPNNRHYAFGFGIHRCLGSHLAKVELRVLLGEVLGRLGDYVIDEGGVERYAGPNRGLSRLPVTFTPGARSTASP